MSEIESCEVKTSIVVFIFILLTIIVLKNFVDVSVNDGEATDAYKRLRDRGYTTQQIYEMGKDQ